jgi:hypothetical protein
VSDPKTEAMIEHLLLQNALEISGIDEYTGEMLYSITDKLEQVNPKLYYQLKKQYDDYMFELIDLGPKTMNWRISI